jgi:spore maturation protein CgeB
VRVLILGKRGGILQWFENVIDGFLELPDIEFRSFAVNHADFFDRVFKGTLKKCSQKLFDQVVANQFAATLSSFCPDLVLIVDCFYIPKELFEALESNKKSTLVAWWIGDLFDIQSISNLTCVDKFYFTDSYFVDYAAENGIDRSSYLPLACNPSVYSLNNHGIRDPRLVFVGAYAKNRETLFRQIDQPMLVVGKNWDRLGDSVHHIRPKRISLRNVNEIYNQHIGVLNIKNSGNVVNGLNMRTFDAPVSGCVVLNDAVGDLERCFEVGKELLVYHDIEELNDNVKRIVKHKTECLAIAKAGRSRVLSEHLYKHRIISILNDLFGSW